MSQGYAPPYEAYLSDVHVSLLAWGIPASSVVLVDNDVEVDVGRPLTEEERTLIMFTLTSQAWFLYPNKSGYRSSITCEFGSPRQLFLYG